jgi:mannose-6-phosphate isomerase-like protein (cupin superfamily)
MAEYTKVNLKEDVEDAAVGYGLSPGIEFRSCRGPLGLEHSGLSYQRLAPGFRVPFGHRHKTQEEVYVIVSGAARLKLEDEVVELRQWDAIRVPQDTMRAFEAGPDGVELLAVGAPGTAPGDAEMDQGFWSD